ncbi:cysteine proteinase [Cystobasidium minutum MCA 4210]|uniref:cysteine proteinase n=1 Tax=Cystobasidium minutum MCA 4210 TaxID=1397322 RepID=UPI0034CEB5C8|eukprot:jgi/Rhomi1/112544/CE112543_732
MVARGRPPKKSNNGNASYKAKGGSGSGGGGGSKKAANSSNNGGSTSGGVTHRARDKTRGQGARLYSDPFNDERQLEAQLKRLGLYAANTLGDGSCLFRSLSDQMHGTPNHHLTIRHEVCNFLLQHKDEFIAFIDDSNHSSPDKAYNFHVAEMRNSATYGTQLEIVAFARMFKRKIKVIQAELIYVIGYEDESPSARAEREAKEKANGHARRDSKGKMKEVEEELPDLYIVYHNWEHYSSARNIAGPHSGLPCIKEATPPAAEATTESSTSATQDDVSTSNEPTQEESLILSSLRYPHRHSITEIRKLIKDSNGSWELALESLLENEIDETESEDFNHHHHHHHAHSPPPPSSATDSPMNSSIPLSPPAIGIIAATPGLHTSQLPSSSSSHHHHHIGQNQLPRSSSPSASSSATSATNASQSTTATQLSDLVDASGAAEHRDRKISNASSGTGKKTKARSSSKAAAAASGLASHLLANNGGVSSSKIRSRAASPDPEFEAAESPRQRFRLSNSVTSTASATSDGGASTPGEGSAYSPDSTGGSADGDANNASSTVSGPGHAQATASPASSRAGTPGVISPVKSSRFPKRRVAMNASLREPTRRQRKQAAKSGSPIGVQTRSKVSTAQESGLQREFKELYV